MSVETEAFLIYGAPYMEVLDKQPDLYDLLDSEGLVSASPWYDSEQDQWTVGVKVDPARLTAGTAMESRMYLSDLILDYQEKTNGAAGKLQVVLNVT